ncbi:MAG: hypothetical protein ACR2QF_09595 [Geminicoccaceae bacterium]
MAYMLDSTTKDAPAFDRHEANAIWERLQEQALRGYRARNTAAAHHGWAKALDVAKRHFSRGDPRLATSYTNMAFSLLREQQIYQAQRHFETAVLCWEDSWRWIPLMVPPHIDDQIQETQYNEATQKEFYAFIERGRSITKTLARAQRLPIGGLEDWLEQKPKSMCDLRKLTAAVFLIVSQER